MTTDTKRSKRRRVKTCRYEDDVVDNDEARLIQRAIENSRRETERLSLVVPEAPVFYPSVEEFKNPLQYINSIRESAEKYGICKIVPPAEWSPPPVIDFNSSYKIPTKKQVIHTLQQGRGFDDGRSYTLSEYKEMADAFAEKWASDHYGGVEHRSQELIRRDYWDMVETSQLTATVEYGNDLDTVAFQSGFPRPIREANEDKSEEYLSTEGIETEREGHRMFDEEYYARTGWNLNLLPYMKGSIIRHMKASVNGINVPWLYVGMQFASFCWHTEDNYLYSMNYSHTGEDKQWYGVPAASAKLFEKTSKEMLALVFAESPDQLQHMNLQMGPSQLIGRGVPVYQTRQQAGSFIVTFPMAYHGGFSYGFNVGEACNFACPDWLRFGGDAGLNYRQIGRPSVLSFDRLLFTILHNIDELPLWAHSILSDEIVRVLTEESILQDLVVKQGVNDTSNRVVLGKNKFDCIDSEACDYDEKRTCKICNQACIFSAIICGCDNVRVSCPRHYRFFCKCPPERKFLITWATKRDLTSMKEKVLSKTSSDLQLSNKAPHAKDISMGSS